MAYETLPSLLNTPQLNTVSVRDLLRRVSDGHIRIPEFQRPLRWKVNDVKALFDSILRGYPIGSLLFWARPADAETITIGAAHKEVGASPSAWWVVDGQQRITALAATLMDLDQGGDPRWNLRFDPEAFEFRKGRIPRSRTEKDVPMSVLGDPLRYIAWVRNSALGDDAIRQLDAAHTRILNYSIPGYVVETEDEQVLRNIFTRSNSSGIRMRADEVFTALAFGGSESRGEDIDLETLQRECDRDGFGRPLRADLLKAVLAMSGLSPTSRPKVLSDTVPGDFVAASDAKEALGRTVDFLMQDCEIPQVSLIPYGVVFSILARWFYLHPDTDEASRKTLVQWLWRGAASGTHRRDEVSKMNQQVKDIDEDQAKSLARLLKRVPSEPETRRWELRRFTRGARPNIETLALLSLGPSHQQHGPLNGALTAAELVSTGRIAREIFSADDVADSERELAKTAANRILLDGADRNLRQVLKEWTWNEDSDALRSHLIDQDSFESLRNNDARYFLKSRAVKVEAATQEFLRRKCQWDEPVVQPISLYLEDEE